MQEAVSDLSKFLFLFLFFSLTKIYYPFFPLNILMSLRVLHVLHNSTSPSQSCSCDSAGNKSKQGFNSFFFIFSSQPSTPQVLHAWLPLPHAHCSRTFPPSLLWHNCRWVSFLLPQQLLFQGVRQRFGMCVSAVVLLLWMHVAKHGQDLWKAPLQASPAWLAAPSTYWDVLSRFLSSSPAVLGWALLPPAGCSAPTPMSKAGG